MTASDHHLASLDALRGITIAGMILVNNPGNWNAVFEPLTHAFWDGCTIADVVFPFFLFILGAAMPFAFSRRTSRGHTRRDLYRRIGRRTAVLIVLGLILNAVASLPAAGSMRIPGVLQRIAVVYLAAAVIVMDATPAQRVVIIAVLLLGEWALLVWVPSCSGPTDLGQQHNLGSCIDRAVFGRHTLTTTGDPEGILTTLPAIATALVGSFAGDWLRSERVAATTRVKGLALCGLAAVSIGLIWASVLPLNKSLWTGSYVAVTAGLAAVMLGMCYLLVDVSGHRAWARPFLWLGFNPLAIYFLSEFTGHLSDETWLRIGAQSTTPRSWLFWDVFRPLLPSRIGDEWVSLLYALITVSVWTAIAGLFYRRGWRFHV
jgi:predicted acyltransferase